MSEKEILTHSVPTCPICGAQGTYLYHDLKDFLSPTKGLWGVRTCLNKSCGTLWLDPAPQEKELYKLYARYSTHHAPQSTPRKSGVLRNLLEYIRSSFLNVSYGYHTSVPLIPRHILSFLGNLHPAWRDAQAANIFYLPARTGGRVLDVGCGNGSSLLALEKKGWRGVGIDFDSNAISYAKAQGLEAHVGELREMKFPSDSFDAIIMNHVIEHVPDPTALLAECRRILKPDGVLTALTPNAASRGHTRFKEHWRGLEIPRHLQIFTPSSLALAGKKAGFQKVRGFSSIQGALYIFDASAQMKSHGTYDIPAPDKMGRLINQIRWYIAGLRHVILKNKDEVAVLVCKK